MVNPTAPVQDDDAELVKRLRALRVILKSGDYNGGDLMRAWCAMTAAADRIEALSPTPETGLVEALKRIDEQLWATHGSSNVEALIACLKSVENIVRDALSNVLPDEV